MCTWCACIEGAQRKKEKETERERRRERARLYSIVRRLQCYTQPPCWEIDGVVGCVAFACVFKNRTFGKTLLLLLVWCQLAARAYKRILHRWRLQFRISCAFFFFLLFIYIVFPLFRFSARCVCKQCSGVTEFCFGCRWRLFCLYLCVVHCFCLCRSPHTFNNFHLRQSFKLLIWPCAFASN